MFKNSTLYGTTSLLLQIVPKIRDTEIEEVPHSDTLQFI
ncbi:hypothetical protein SMGD1_0246 [Sulfurimonas gotlandica GD1]|uniref:Uncharacterized protein n=1 Tax=Sulfurimonas gotlandica (strain DSM 19862 / JCM 16533 / GD1) TaxID=929558 RepID=B6BL38_SULGG|nr:hypothetical protein CBGD1_2744 [Sulfurimonas gotlandica GD1]EHP28773.1 hypothetical protein SMGD1_0246 [Sulfurimonas gotlandica GD1]